LWVDCLCIFLVSLLKIKTMAGDAVSWITGIYYVYSNSFRYCTHGEHKHQNYVNVYNESMEVHDCSLQGHTLRLLSLPDFLDASIGKILKVETPTWNNENINVFLTLLKNLENLILNCLSRKSVVIQCKS
jgi:hypothetical protein